MNDNKYNPQNKEIRFIDPNYKELFRISDGGSIVVTRPMGEMYSGVQEQWVGTCKFLDECHTEIDGECYHICQFAEIQARIGSTYEPETEPEMVGSYRIIQRVFVGEKVYELGHSAEAVQKYATWQGYKDKSLGHDWGHYWSSRSDALGDLLRRADSERTGKPYDYTKYAKQRQEKSKDKGR
jgi:hypothetical protein